MKTNYLQFSLRISCWLLFILLVWVAGMGTQDSDQKSVELAVEQVELRYPLPA